MRRGFTLVILLFSMFWQAVAVAGYSTAQEMDVEHVLLHAHGDSHHHHDDGSFSQSDSSESRQHIAADGVLASPALFTEATFTFMPAVRADMPAMHERALPWPSLDGLRRPPRLTA